MRTTPAVIELVVADLPASIAFYRLLGLEFPDGAESEPHVEAAFGSLRLAFDTIETVTSIEGESWEPPRGGHRVALAFSCESPAEVDTAYAELVAAGAQGHRAPWDAFWGMRYAVVHDPDGNPVDLFAPLGTQP